ncbi:MAG: hypothetical protein HS132_16215 [Planctomycetia bacterium]|nr:hypothetical protein [Planctomycetia bacterium]
MKSIKWFFAYLVLIAISCVYIDTLFGWSGGPPAYRTGAPKDIGTCNDAGCHNSFELNSGNAIFHLKMKPVVRI